jgi:hypothetical protein
MVSGYLGCVLVRMTQRLLYAFWRINKRFVRKFTVLKSVRELFLLISLTAVEVLGCW